MTIKFFCVHCGKEYRVKDEAAGKKGECKECGGVVEVPAAKAREVSSEPVEPADQPEPSSAQAHEVNCPHCFGSIIVDGDQSGRPETCPHCQNSLSGKADVSRPREVSLDDSTPSPRDQQMMRLGGIGVVMLFLGGIIDFPLVSLIGTMLMFAYGVHALVHGRLAILSRKKISRGAGARIGGTIIAGIAILFFVGVADKAAFLSKQMHHGKEEQSLSQSGQKRQRRNTVCRSCGGSGKVASLYERARCSVCGGRGTGFTPSGHLIVCPGCGGTGKSSRPKEYPCSECFGTGIINYK